MQPLETRDHSLDVVQVLPSNAVLDEQVNRLSEREFEGTLRALAPLELVGRELFPDSVDLFRILLPESAEHVQEEPVEQFHDLVVVLLDGHLEIKPDELGHMPVSVGVLGTEDGADFVDTLEVSSNCHLLGKLRRLREERLACDVILENNRVADSGDVPLK